METYLNDVLGKRAFEKIPEITSPTMLDHTQPGKLGVEALDAHARSFCSNTPDVEVEVLKFVADDHSVAGIWRWQGETRQPSGVSAKGTPICPHIVCSLFTIKDDLIQEYQVFVDAVDVFSQLAQ